MTGDDGEGTVAVRAIPHKRSVTANDLLAEVLAEVRALRAENSAMRQEMAARLAPAPTAGRKRVPARLLSVRHAAERLGVSAGRTLAPAIADGRVRTVSVEGRPRVPVAEVERIERDGLPEAKKAQTPRPMASDLGAAIARLDLGVLTAPSPSSSRRASTLRPLREAA